MFIHNNDILNEFIDHSMYSNFHALRDTQVMIYTKK